MNKAEELSRQYVLPFLDEYYKKYGEYRQMTLSKFDGYDMMSAYEEGYHQAEKNVALTWEDVRNIIGIYEEVEDMDSCSDIYGEVLNRFNKYKEDCKI